jgi:glycosyltransferase involved in cell wall biosynthesis
MQVSRDTTVSFVIPSYNSFHLVNQLLVDINEHTLPDEIIVVDDCSTDKAAIDGLLWWARNMNVKVRTTPENLNFLKASNWGMRQATSDIVCLISTDVRIHKDLAAIAKAMTAVEGKVLLGGRYFNCDTGWNTFGEKTFPYVEGWLLIAKKEHWEELGYFDERYAPNDFEDVDLSTTAISKGFSLAQITPDGGTVVEHIGAQSIPYNDERYELTTRNREKFREKWLP